MNKRILLVEPAYKSKYPPLGLMKIAAYHKVKGDTVFFVRGCNSKMRDQFWDRIYITTLFTYTWDETVKTINFYKETLFGMTKKCFVGGILATLMPNELFEATGIQPIAGILDGSNKLGQDDDIIIDQLPPDYSILQQVEVNGFKYSNTDAYLGYSTRGCINRCKFCAVHRLEPEFIPMMDIRKMIKQIIETSGEKQNLLLMDNNVLASDHFDDIIDAIKEAGFAKGATFGKTRRKRTVDFNQGLEGKLLTEAKMKRLAEINLDPMRIAFDNIALKDIYIKAVRLAHKYGQANMSNYILYNFTDTPEDFYERLKINIDLNEEFSKNTVKTSIYSFPMRYIPLDAKSRSVSTKNPHWNKRYLRGLQVILNVMKGPVMPGADFFYQAFGRDYQEFKAILLMPDDFIRNRLVDNWRKISDPVKRMQPYVRDWHERYSTLPKQELTELITTLSTNDMVIIKQHLSNTTNKDVKKLLEYHLWAEDIVRTRK